MESAVVVATLEHEWSDYDWMWVENGIMQSYTQIFNTLRHVLKLYSQQCTRNSTALSLTPIQCPSGSKRQVKAVRLQRRRAIVGWSLSWGEGTFLFFLSAFTSYHDPSPSSVYIRRPRKICEITNSNIYPRTKSSLFVGPPFLDGWMLGLAQFQITMPQLCRSDVTLYSYIASELSKSSCK